MKLEFSLPSRQREDFFPGKDLGVQSRAIDACDYFHASKNTDVLIAHHHRDLGLEQKESIDEEMSNYDQYHGKQHYGHLFAFIPFSIFLKDRKIAKYARMLRFTFELRITELTALEIVLSCHLIHDWFLSNTNKSAQNKYLKDSIRALGIQEAQLKKQSHYWGTHRPAGGGRYKCISKRVLKSLWKKRCIGAQRWHLLIKSTVAMGGSKTQPHRLHILIDITI